MAGRVRELVRRPAVVGGLVGLLVGLVVLGPALAPGYVLHYDMVFVPRLGLGGHTLGVDGDVPRAVPTDALVALASHLVPGWLVQKLVLLLAFVGLGAGVGAWCATGLGAAAGAVAATWNPWVAERLSIGHWPFLLGCAVLPWAARAARDLALAGESCARPRARVLGWTVAAALCTSTGAVLAALTTAIAYAVALLGRAGPVASPGRAPVGEGAASPDGEGVAARPGDRDPSPSGARPASRARARVHDLALWLVVLVGANAPWWWGFLVLAPADAADPAGVAAFGARPDGATGTLGALLAGGGGIWNQRSQLPDREALLIGIAALLACLAVVVLAWRAVPRVRGLVVAGLVGVALAAAPAIPGGTTAITWVVTNVPGGGLLRDSQKLAAPWAVAVAACAGLVTERFLAWSAGRREQMGVARPVIAVALLVWPVALLPSLALGRSGTWGAVTYPREVTRAAAYLDDAPPGAVTVLPFTLYRSFAWDGHRTVLDPWQRLVERRVVVNDDLPLQEMVVKGESPRATSVAAALTSGDPVAGLRAQGVRYVVELTDQPDPRGELRLLAAAPVVSDEGGVRVRDLGPVTAEALARARGPTGADRFVGLVVGALTAVAVAVTALRARRGATTSESHEKSDPMHSYPG